MASAISPREDYTVKQIFQFNAVHVDWPAVRINIYPVDRTVRGLCIHKTGIIGSVRMKFGPFGHGTVPSCHLSAFIDRIKGSILFQGKCDAGDSYRPVLLFFFRQDYGVFPLLARAVLRRPVATLSCIALITFAFRAWCLWGLQDYTMVVNQLLNFGDVYALGILAAILYVRLRQHHARLAEQKKRRLLWESAATVCFILVLWGLLRLLRLQAASSGYPQLQARQMTLRPVFALCFAVLTLCCSFCLAPLRRLLGNRITRFLAGLSMNYYLTHQTIIVHLKRIGFPPSVSETPNMAGEQPWQTQYTLLAFSLSFLAALIITYGVEKPMGKWLSRKFSSPSPSPSPASSADASR